jgi:hypothetical protein
MSHIEVMKIIVIGPPAEWIRPASCVPKHNITPDIADAHRHRKGAMGSRSRAVE